MYYKSDFVFLMNKCSTMQTRDLILQKTLGLLLQKGYNGVSISDIQQQTGMARGLLYHYFGSQNGLFEEVVCKYLSEWFYLEQEVRKNKTIGELIVQLTEMYGRIGNYIVENLEGNIFLSDVEVLFYEAMRQNEKFSELYFSSRENRFSLWKTALLNSFGAGELQSGINMESVARQFVYVQEGALLNSRKQKSMSDAVYYIEKSLRDFFEIIRR